MRAAPLVNDGGCSCTRPRLLIWAVYGSGCVFRAQPGIWFPSRASYSFIQQKDLYIANNPHLNDAGCSCYAATAMICGSIRSIYSYKVTRQCLHPVQAHIAALE